MLIKKEAINLIIIVLDDGVGMVVGNVPGNELDGRQIKQNSGSQYGVKNIEQRLCLYYGIEKAMTFSSFPGIGTTVTICVPVRKKESYIE